MMIQVDPMGRLDLYAGAPNDTPRNAHHRGAGRHMRIDDRVGAYAHPIADPHRTQNLGAGADQNAIAQGGMPLFLVPGRAAQGDPVIQGDVIANLRSLADDHTGAMINEQSASDGGAGMDIDIGDPAGDKRHPARQQFPVLAPESVRHPVHEYGVDARISKQNLQPRTRGRIAIEHTVDILVPFRPQTRADIP